MNLVGFNLRSISAEKFSGDFKEMKVENNISIENIESVKVNIFKKDEETLQITFSYILDYKPDLAKLTFSGNVLLLVGLKEAKKILKLWEDKKVPDDLKLNLFNIILRKTSIKALELEDDLNLPLHISLPYLRPKKQEKD